MKIQHNHSVAVSVYKINTVVTPNEKTEANIVHSHFYE